MNTCMCKNTCALEVPTDYGQLSTGSKFSVKVNHKEFSVKIK